MKNAQQIREGLLLFFGLGFKDKKTVKELRKNQNLTAKDLADKLKLNTVDILKIDDLRLKDIAEPLRPLKILKVIIFHEITNLVLWCNSNPHEIYV